MIIFGVSEMELGSATCKAVFYSVLLLWPNMSLLYKDLLPIEKNPVCGFRSKQSQILSRFSAALNESLDHA